MNFVVTTKGEWEAFRLVMELYRQMDASHDRLLVWDDESPAEWKAQMLPLLAAMKNANLVTDPLCKHFAEHRNRVKPRFPTGEMILMLDADEWIQPGFVDSIRARLYQVPAIDAIFLERRNTFWEDYLSPVPPEIDYSKSFKPDFQARGFRNLADIHYEGATHEGLHGYDWPVFLTGKPYTLIHHKRNVPPRYTLWK